MTMSKEKMDKELGMCKKCDGDHKTEECSKKMGKHKALKKRSKSEGKDEMAKVDAPGAKGKDIKR